MSQSPTPPHHFVRVDIPDMPDIPGHVRIVRATKPDIPDIIYRMSGVRVAVRVGCLTSMSGFVAHIGLSSRLASHTTPSHKPIRRASRSSLTIRVNAFWRASCVRSVRRR